MAAGKTIKHMKNLSDFSHIEISSAKPFRFGIITAQWHSDVTNALYQSAYDRLKKHGALDEHIVNIPVPGSYELTSGANMLLELGQVDVVICLGCVILGETRHFDFICDAVANGIIQAAQMLADRGEPISKPIVCRIDGNNAALGRKILDDSGIALIERVETMDDAARRVAQLAAGK